VAVYEWQQEAGRLYAVGDEVTLLHITDPVIHIKDLVIHITDPVIYITDPQRGRV
jgi:hypothetical protein